MDPTSSVAQQNKIIAHVYEALSDPDRLILAVVEHAHRWKEKPLEREEFVHGF